MPESPSKPFGRLLTAMVTPMADDGSVDFAAAAYVLDAVELNQ